MRIDGTKLVCDRCGIEDFTTQVFKPGDNPYPSNVNDTFIDNSLVRIPGWGIRNGKELCKCCKDEYDRQQQEFFSNRI